LLLPLAKAIFVVDFPNCRGSPVTFVRTEEKDGVWSFHQCCWLHGGSPVAAGFAFSPKFVAVVRRCWPEQLTER